MPDKRSFSPDSSSSDRPAKRPRSDSIESWDGCSNKKLKVFVVQAKLENKIPEIFYLIESHGHRDDDDGLQLQLCDSVEKADIIITAIRMSKRLERHIDWNIARQKAIVTTDWLQESIKQNRPVPCGPFAALTELHDMTVENCPGKDHKSQPDRSDQSKEPSLALPSPPSSAISSDAVESIKPTGERIKNNWRAKYACQRAHPLFCPNQGLVNALNVLGRSRELEGLAVNALAYERAVAILKSYPYVITRERFRQDITKLPGVGSKVQAKIEEYLKTGIITETETTLESERYHCLSLFTSIYGVGPSTARQLYEIGLRTVEDLERYYDVPPNIDPSQLEGLETQLFTPNGLLIPPEKGPRRSKIPPVSMKVALALRKDFSIPMSRSEVEEIHRAIIAELNEMQSGCVSTIVGGYRRGKTDNNDVDIVISHLDTKNGAGVIKGLCARFTKRLYERGMVTHIMHLSGFHNRNPLRVEHWDSLEKALTVFKLPTRNSPSPAEVNQATRKPCRRVDLIFAPPDAYWTAVIGWSGSRMFERDLRLWAKVEKGMKFDSSGLTRRHDSKLYMPRSEEDVFKILGLEWIDPTLRNANV